MSENKEYYLSEELKKILLRPILRFEPKSAARLAREKKDAEELRIANAEPGDMIEGQGVFLGQYSPKDRSGQSLGKIFNVFAAPEDLPETMTYTDAVKYIAELKNWHGFNGTNYAIDKEIFSALKDGSYTGGWIIPTRELLAGTEVCGPRRYNWIGAVVQPDNLFDHQSKGALKGTFKTSASKDNPDRPNVYWSSTQYGDVPSTVWGIKFWDGQKDWGIVYNDHLSCRPVRLVEVTPPPRPFQ